MNNRYNLRSFCFNASNYGDDGFVGLNFENNERKIVFPLGYAIPEDDNECRKSILSLLRILSFSKANFFTSNFGINDGEFFELPVNSYLWVINDFLSNGIYYDIEKSYVQNQNGKINWKKTLGSKFYVSNESIIYLNPYVEKKYNQRNIITDIHCYCIKKSIDEIGWLFGNIKSPESNLDSNNIKYYIRVLNDELVKTFDDRKKRLIINMKKILDSSSNGQDGLTQKKYGTTNFEHIWEHMINEVFGNEDVQKFFPSSSWHILDWKEIQDSKLRPDTVLVKEKDLYILDAKYYKFGLTGNQLHLPHTDSIQKQITYGEYAFLNKDYEKIYNAFVVPFNKDNNKFGVSKNIEYIGFAKSNWKFVEKDNYFQHVALILMDTKYLMDCYFKHNFGDSDLLINSIEKVIGSFKQETN